jgi:predicted DNA-binding transcriptional regulator AlpA
MHHYALTLCSRVGRIVLAEKRNPAATLIGQGGDFLFPAKGAAPMKSQTVDDFCTSHGISRGLFYQLIKRGEAPKTFKIGRCTRISEAAAIEWVASREALAA